LLLAQAIGPDGHVTDLDSFPKLLVYAEEIVEQVGLSEQITFREGDSFVFRPLSLFIVFQREH
jgi:predicted O-methyltransferase YrrM